MNYSIEFGGHPQDLTITLSGSADPRSILELVDDLVAHPEHRAEMLILTDLSGLDTSSITLEQYEAVADVLAGRDHRFPARAIALVAPPGRTFDDAMQHRAYVGGSRSRREVFTSREAAIAWLERQR